MERSQLLDRQHKKVVDRIEQLHDDIARAVVETDEGPSLAEGIAMVKHTFSKYDRRGAGVLSKRDFAEALRETPTQYPLTGPDLDLLFSWCALCPQPGARLSQSPDICCSVVYGFCVQ